MAGVFPPTSPSLRLRSLLGSGAPATCPTPSQATAQVPGSLRLCAVGTGSKAWARAMAGLPQGTALSCPSPFAVPRAASTSLSCRLLAFP